MHFVKKSGDSKYCILTSLTVNLVDYVWCVKNPSENAVCSKVKYFPYPAKRHASLILV